jgi:pyruvate/2-oxoglutarate/acetoin dehydrogenase E1 component
MTYKDCITREMKALAENPVVYFLGQQVAPEDFYGTLKDIPLDKRIEMPVAEEMQMGISIGMSLEGLLPVSIYQRMDFLPRAMDQIVNHLNIIHRLSHGTFSPRVIIRVTIGATAPLHPGLQHAKNLIRGFQALVDFPVLDLLSKEDIVAGYKQAREMSDSIMLVERQALYDTSV